MLSPNNTHQILLATISYRIICPKSLSFSFSAPFSAFFSFSRALFNPSGSSAKIHLLLSSPTSTCPYPPTRFPLASYDSFSACPVATACSLAFIRAYRSRAYRSSTIPRSSLTTSSTRKMSKKTTTMVSAAMASSLVQRSQSLVAAPGPVGGGGPPLPSSSA